MRCGRASSFLQCFLGDRASCALKLYKRERGVTRKQLKGILPDDGERGSCLLLRSRALLKKVALLQCDASMIALVGHDGVLQAISEPLIDRLFDRGRGQPCYVRHHSGVWQIYPDTGRRILVHSDSNRAVCRQAFMLCQFFVVHLFSAIQKNKGSICIGYGHD